MKKKKPTKSISPIREMNFMAHDCLFHEVGTLLGENSFHAFKMSIAIFLSYSWSVHLFMGKLGYLVRYFKQFLSSRHSQDLRKEKKTLVKVPINIYERFLLLLLGAHKFDKAVTQWKRCAHLQNFFLHVA